MTKLRIHACHSLIAVSLLAAVMGCHTMPAENLPAYAWVDRQTALTDLCHRARSVRTVSAETAMTLTRRNGDSVRLDGAIVMRIPDSVRMRAWKFGQAVFDLTLTPDGLWIESPDDPGRREKVMPASLSAAKTARAWSIMSGEFFCAADARVEEAGGDVLRVERMLQNQRILCEVQRSTLTPRKYTVIDAAGVTRFTLTLDHYKMIGTTPWATHMAAKSDGGEIVIELKDPELNGDIAPNAFVPPRKAEKIP